LLLLYTVTDFYKHTVLALKRFIVFEREQNAVFHFKLCSLLFFEIKRFNVFVEECSFCCYATTLQFLLLGAQKYYLPPVAAISTLATPLGKHTDELAKHGLIYIVIYSS